MPSTVKPIARPSLVAEADSYAILMMTMLGTQLLLMMLPKTLPKVVYLSTLLVLMDLLPASMVKLLTDAVLSKMVTTTLGTELLLNLETTM